MVRYVIEMTHLTIIGSILPIAEKWSLRHQRFNIPFSPIASFIRMPQKIYGLPFTFAITLYFSYEKFTGTTEKSFSET